MVTMIDETFDRQYREAREELNSTILDLAARLRSAVGDAFAVLNRIEYSAPWTAKPRRARSH